MFERCYYCVTGSSSQFCELDCNLGCVFMLHCCWIWVEVLQPDTWAGLFSLLRWLNPSILSFCYMVACLPATSFILHILNYLDQSSLDASKSLNLFLIGSSSWHAVIGKGLWLWIFRVCIASHQSDFFLFTYFSSFFWFTMRIMEILRVFLRFWLLLSHLS